MAEGTDMADPDNKDLEQAFSQRNETLRGFYHTESLAMSDEELASLTPILNSLKDEVPRYREIGKIAEGGEKKISLVHDHRLDRRVAMAHAVRGESRQDLEQFLREARLTANLAHPNIMPVYNMGLDSAGAPFFTMELVPGDSLKTIIKKLKDGNEAYNRDFSLKALLNIFIKVCDAIAFAHSRNVLHLDIKPDNIRVGEFGEVLVCDWGLARVVNDPEEADGLAEEMLDGDVLNDMTLSGTMKGTPGFMAPEQTKAYSEKTPQTDIYALGALLYMLMTYELPVLGESANEVIQNTREGKIVPPRSRKPGRKIPRGLAPVAIRALALDPADRYASVLALKEEINRFLSGHPTEAEHAGWMTQAALLLQRHSRTAALLMFLLVLFAFVVGGNLVAISREKAIAIAARVKAEENFSLYLKETELTRELGQDLGEAVRYTVRSRDFINAPSMIHVLETGLNENMEPVERQNLLEQKGVLHFVLQEFNAANECFEAAGNTKRTTQLDELSRRYAEIKPVDRKRLTDVQLAGLFAEAKSANNATLFYLYYHHMRRRPASALPEQYLPLAAAVLDRLNNARNNRPLHLEKTAGGYHLDLSRAPYSVYLLNILGVYNRNVLLPLDLRSLDISYSSLDNLGELRGLVLDELRMAEVKVENTKNLAKQVEALRLKRLVLTVADYPKPVVAELRKIVEVVDAGKREKATPARRAGAGSPGSAAP